MDPIFSLRPKAADDPFCRKDDIYIVIGRLGCRKVVFDLLALSTVTLIILGILAFTGVIPTGIIGGSVLVGSSALTLFAASFGYRIHYQDRQSKIDARANPSSP